MKKSEETPAGLAANVGLLLLSHGPLADALRETVNVLEPEQIEPLGALSLAWDEAPENASDRLQKAIAKADRGRGVVLLTDMFGGTPSNLAISVMSGRPVEVIAGINLPMLVKLATVRSEKPLAEAVLHAQEAGRKYINIASRVLAGH